MFADLHHLHQFISLDQGGSVTGASWVGGTNATDANIYFGKLILEKLTGTSYLWLMWCVHRCPPHQQGQRR